MARSHYLGNIHLKASRVAVQYTAQQIVEYARCADDPIYFIRNYVKIISLDHGLVAFDLYDYQVRFIEAIHNNRMVIGMMPRQHGKTQVVAAYLLWYMMFSANKTVAILANKAAAAREIMSRIQFMYENLPNWLQQGVEEWNKGSIKFENNSGAFTAATSNSGIRGRSVNLLYVDETAIIPNNVADEFFTSTYPTISSGTTTKVVLTSTPLGLNHFWKFWTEAEQKINDFIPIRVHYHEHPLHDDAWAAEQKRLLGDVKYNQEVACEFLGSSHTLISASAIQRMAAKKPLYMTEDGIRVYEDVEKGVGSYIMVVDPSRGLGQDSSAFSVVRVDKLPYSVVMCYSNPNMAPLLFPTVIHKWAKRYNEAWVLIESNTAQQIPHVLHYEYEYENLIYVVRDTRKGQVATYGFGGKARIGVETDKKTKRLGCSMFKTLVEEGKLLIHDTLTISEISTFIQVRDSYQADEGCHDDNVMTLVLFGWLAGQDYFKDLTDVNLRTHIYQKRVEQIEAETLPVGYFNDGRAAEHEEVWQDWHPG